MVFESIRDYLGSLNFALTQTNGRGICILKNLVGNGQIFCVLLDNTQSIPWSTTQISSVDSQLKEHGDPLFIVVTDNLERDRSLSELSGTKLWLVDSVTGQIFIYENQVSDFYGIRGGMESAALRVAENPSDLSTAKKTRLKNVPFVTICLIFLNAAYFVLLIMQGNPQNATFMLDQGANYGPYIFENFEVWRLLTCMFMHFSFSHLAGNMLYLAILGYQLEKTIGRWKFLLIYMLSGIGASLVSAAYYYLTDSNTVTAGASGAIYGLIGVFVYLTILTARGTRSSTLFLRIGIALIFIFYSTFMSSNVDGAAHVGGFIFGFILSILFLHPKTKTRGGSQ